MAGKASKMNERLNFKSVEELLGVVNEESAMDIEICKISSFKGHPFKVVDDEKMQELVESIKTNGVLSPVLIRPTGMDTYEMISGHRRLHAAQLAGLTAIPSIIREMTDDESVIAMVDANIQREELLPSEKAWACKMKLEAMKHQGERKDLSEPITSAQNGRKLETADILGEEMGISRAQIRRYIRLTELIPEMLDYVDKKRIPFTVAVDISYLDKEIQKWLFEYIRDNGLIKPKQIALLREACKTGIMTEGKLIAILNDSQPGRTPSTKNLISEKKLRKYFPSDYTEEDMRSVIVELLDRMSLSMKNGWFDEENRVYIIYQISKIQADLGFSKRKAMDYLSELEEFGLVKKKKRGFGLPSIIYVKSFMIQKNYARSIETGTSAEKKILSRSADFGTSEQIECTSRGCDISTSEVTKSTLLEVPESAPLNNKTNILPTSCAASPISTKEPISSSTLVCANTSSVIILMKRIFMPSISAI